MKKYYFTPVTKMAIVAAILTLLLIIAVSLCKAEATQPEEAQPEIELVCVWDNVPLDIELQEFVVEECKKHDIRPQIIFAMIQAESGCISPSTATSTCKHAVQHTGSRSSSARHSCPSRAVVMRTAMQ